MLSKIALPADMLPVMDSISSFVLDLQWKLKYALIMRKIRIPGRKPAINSLETDVLVAAPKITSVMLGGMIVLIEPDEATRPVAIFAPYNFSSGL